MQRNSSGGYVKGRHQLRVLAAADRRNRGRLGRARLMSIRGCNRLQGLLTSASLVWIATPLTTAKFFATTSIDETTRARRLRRADAHLHRRSRPRFPPLADRHRQIHLGHLSNTRATTASTRFYSLSGDLIYKLNRNIWLKGTLRRDWLDSNQPGQQHGIDGGDAGREAAELGPCRSRSNSSCPAQAGHPVRRGFSEFA